MSKTNDNKKKETPKNSFSANSADTENQNHNTKKESLGRNTKR